VEGQQCLKLSLTNRSIGLISQTQERRAQRQARSTTQHIPRRFASPITCTQQRDYVHRLDWGVGLVPR